VRNGACGQTLLSVVFGILLHVSVLLLLPTQRAVGPHPRNVFQVIALSKQPLAFHKNTQPLLIALGLMVNHGIRKIASRLCDA
jgi:hypothetical protein